MQITVEHHTGSKRNKFRGKIYTLCSQCRGHKCALSFTGDHRKIEESDTLNCSCGKDQFYAAQLERYEGGDGLFGFFDEGVVVSQCAYCDKQKIVVLTD